MPEQYITLPDGTRATYDASTQSYIPVAGAAKFAKGKVDPIFGSYEPTDLAAAQSRGAKEAAIAAGIGALGSLGQAALTAAPTAADTENKKRLAELAKHKGLSQGERAEIDEQAMRGVRAMATQSQKADEALLAGSQTHSAADLATNRLVNQEAVNRAAIEAADIGIRENRAQVQRDVEEEQERILAKDQRQRELVNLAGQTIAGLAPAMGRVVAASPSVTAPTKAQFNAMKGAVDPADPNKPLYPGVQSLTYDQCLANWKARVAAANAPDGSVLPQ